MTQENGNKIDEGLREEVDKKAKGSGSKGASDHMVKSRYSVWPSAYASRAFGKVSVKLVLQTGVIQ